MEKHFVINKIESSNNPYSLLVAAPITALINRFGYDRSDRSVYPDGTHDIKGNLVVRNTGLYLDTDTSRYGSIMVNDYLFNISQRLELEKISVNYDTCRVIIKNGCIVEICGCVKINDGSVNRPPNHQRNGDFANLSTDLLKSKEWSWK